jgi:site-specific DNA-methyltransferase (adenine-specific)
MSLMDADSVDSVVCDPPYGLSKEPDMAEVMRHWLAGDDYTHGGSGFMGKSWDSFVPGPAVWREAYRVLKPGGHLVAFFGTRTYDLGVMALRLAGFEVRDQLAWVFGSGFPKSHDVSKGIDAKLLHGASNPRAIKKAIADRPGAGRTTGTLPNNGIMQNERRGSQTNDEPATPEAAQWQGWGTALKPAYEPIVLCRKPLSEPTVAANVLRWGTGAVNIDGCRVAGVKPQVTQGINTNATSFNVAKERRISGDPNEGRWPANLAHDGSPEVTDGLGEAARFFYCAKASKADRNRGLDDLPEQPSAASEFRPNHTAKAEAGENGNPYGRWSPVRNTHPTVKPTALMQWLVRLVTPPGGSVLDPFMGSGSTGVAAVLEGFDFIGCEMTDEYVPIATARIDNAVNARYTREP